MSDQPIRVLIVDDHAALSWSLAFVFAQEADLRVVATAATLAEAPRHVAARMAGPPAPATAEGRCLRESFWIGGTGPRGRWRKTRHLPSTAPWAPPWRRSPCPSI